MIAEIDKMSPASRVWIYQADRELNEVELSGINEAGFEFVQNWTAHKNPLLAGFAVYYNRFIVFAIDDSIEGASGCSIDKSIHLIREFESEYQISLLNRMNLAYKMDGNIYSCKKQEFEALLKSGKINEQTIVFNNLVENIGQFRDNWEVPLEKSWHKQMI